MALRVLFPFIGDTVGGSHISAWQLICALQELGVEPVILLHIGDGQHACWLHDQGAEWTVANLPVLRAGPRFDKNIWNALKGTFLSRKLLKDLRIDLVHGNDGRVNYAWSLWSRFSKVPMVWHQRTQWSNSIQMRLALPFTHGVISISKFVASMSPKIKKPHEIIYNPILAQQKHDRKQCGKSLRDELGLADDVRLIGCFGNARRLKRPDTVVNMANILKDLIICKFHVLWFGNDRDGYLDKLLRNYGSHLPVSTLPFRSDVSTAMAGCDIVVTASECDAFGRTLLEAMAVGTPVVATDFGGHKEIIEHEYNGLFFPVGDAHACADSIARLLSDENLQERLASSGRKTVKNFMPINHAMQIIDFYAKILQKPRDIVLK